MDPEYVRRRLDSCRHLRARSLTQDAQDFLLHLLEYDPRKRITAHEALLHPFIQAQWGKSLGQTDIPWKGKFDKGVVDKLREFAESPRLKKAALLVLAHLATAQDHSQELLEIRHTFRFIDQDGDGHITCEELQGTLEK